MKHLMIGPLSSATMLVMLFDFLWDDLPYAVDRWLAGEIKLGEVLDFSIWLSATGWDSKMEGL